MASSENQGLQIALIIFVILTLILSVTTFMFFNSHKQAQEALVALNADKKRADDAMRSAMDERNQIREAIGFDATVPFADVKKAIDEDKTKFRAEKPTYRDAISALLTVIAERDATITNTKGELDKLNKSYEGVQAQKVGEIKQHQDAAGVAVDEKTKVMTAFSEKDKQILEDNEKLKAQLEKERQDATAAKEEVEKQLGEVTAKLAGYESQIRDLTSIIRSYDVQASFEEPNGEIVRVDPITRTVWINLGSADQLRRQTTFSVHDRNNHRLDLAKADIEVTEILVDHLAKARITRDDPSNPILSGDHIFSPAFNRGKQVHFALAGVLDVDGDGSDDREIVRSRIAQSGGIIDAEVDPSGKRTGSLSVRTRYLVWGQPPEATPENVQAQKGVEGMDAMLKEARGLGVEQLGIERFLDLIGGHSPTVPVRFGETNKVSQLVDPPKDGGRRYSKGVLHESFRSRRPPTKEKADEKETKAPPKLAPVKPAAPAEPPAEEAEAVEQ